MQVKREQLRRAFHGTVYHSLGAHELECLQDALIGVESSGIIAFVERNVTDPAETLKTKGWQDVELWTLAKGEFLVPGSALGRPLLVRHEDSSAY
jgi:hypothetical protein